jgi:hypothetical protein
VSGTPPQHHLKRRLLQEDFIWPLNDFVPDLLRFVATRARSLSRERDTLTEGRPSSGTQTRKHRGDMCQHSSRASGQRRRVNAGIRRLKRGQLRYANSQGIKSVRFLGSNQDPRSNKHHRYGDDHQVDREPLRYASHSFVLSIRISRNGISRFELILCRRGWADVKQFTSRQRFVFLGKNFLTEGNYFPHRIRSPAGWHAVTAKRVLERIG